MEQSRLFIAIAISFLIFFLWSKFFAPQPPQVPSEAVKEETQSQPAQTEVKKPVGDVKAEPVKPVVVNKPSKTARTLTVDTPLFKMTLSEKGGAVTGLVLKEYREAIEKDSPLKELIHKDTSGGSVLVALSGQGQADFETAVFSTDLENDTLEIKDGPSQIKFQYQAENGLIVEKIYSFTPDSYLIDLKVEVYNGGDQAYQGSLAVELRNSINKDAGRLGFEGPSGYVDGNLQQIKVKDIDEQNKFSGNIRWVAIEDRYFMTSIIPEGDFNGHMKLVLNDKFLKNQIVKDIIGLSPQKSDSVTLKLFMGPKSLSLLKSFNNHLDKAINFGWFDFLAKPCLWFMNFIYKYIPNYGIAIIILTIVTRGIFWPLAKKSYKSMGEMRKIQPLMQEIREKYKDDKTRMNQEMMTLYRTYKINPMGGCLPMLIQLPVFFALYRMLYSAIELRHAPFFGWITDLAAPDRLFNFGFKIPLMEPPYGIPVLTLIMGASMLLQQKMTPTPGDPAQAKMMMLMPVVFTFIFINFSSGLVLYWLVSNIFSMAQQYYTQKRKA
jgi:YidC/Oxa1 family membrane protein insertase